ncbi:UNVERIFIED_CONTAM: hypothetical protein Slati_1314600 [Sesamum latifolium]|uniref:Ty1-copia retrotransposon protein n=1 Tax=Sesamum latifolium TaxID=2727402 RepID=A0AAW2XI80_9LAMI
MAVPVTKVLSDMSKLEPLDGTNYKRWSQKLLIFFEQLDVDYALFTVPPEVEVPAETSSVAITPVMSVKKPEEDAKVKYDKDNKTVRGHLLNHINNTLFDLFVNQKSSKEIWNTLETRYGGDDACMKKYVVGKWLQFHMADDKPIMDQVHEYENLVADVLSEVKTGFKTKGRNSKNEGSKNPSKAMMERSKRTKLHATAVERYDT